MTTSQATTAPALGAHLIIQRTDHKFADASLNLTQRSFGLQSLAQGYAATQNQFMNSTRNDV